MTSGHTHSELARARITVNRQAPRDIGQREVFVALDGKEFAIMRYGDVVTRETEPGPHLLRVHNTMIWKKIEIELQPGEHAHFTVVNRSGWGTYAMAAVLGAGPVYLDVERTTDFEEGPAGRRTNHIAR
jgi:hypothetical protein